MAFAFLGTLKCGAVACPLFSAFADTALTDRLLDSQATIIITNKELFPKIKAVEDSLPSVKKIIIVDSSENSSDRYLTTQSLATSSPDFKTVSISKIDPAYMLYTSGSTGKPKGVIHKHESIDQQLDSAREVFGLSPEDILWCTADPGWITGIAYSLLSPLLNRTLTILYEGKFDPRIWYKIIEIEKVSVFYTAPTAIRMLKGDNESSWRNSDFSSLRIVGSVGEPLNPEALVWAERRSTAF
jgi:acetyl-CoA synthetase